MMVLPLAGAAVAGVATVGRAVIASAAEALAASLVERGVNAILGSESTVNVSMQSSFISELIYNSDTSDLTVNMQNGSSYTYPGIDQGTFEAFATDPSPGSFYNANIKSKSGGLSGVRDAVNIMHGAADIFKGAANIFGKV